MEMDFDKPNSESSKVFIVSKTRGRTHKERTPREDMTDLSLPNRSPFSLPPSYTLSNGDAYLRVTALPRPRASLGPRGGPQPPLGLGGLPSSLLVSRRLPPVTGAICAPAIAVSLTAAGG